MTSDATTILEAQAVPGCGAAGGANLVMILLMLAVFYFLLIRPAQKREKTRREMLSGLQKGDLVVTQGGVLGRICALTDQVVTIEIAEKTRVRVLRSHIAGRQGEASLAEVEK